MTVHANSGLRTENTIGLIACSKHQSGSYMPWAPHRPRIDFEVALNEQTRGPATDYMKRELGYDSTRWSRLPSNPLNSEQFTGHTAVMVRRAGVMTWARGWVPQLGVANYVKTLLRGGAAPGEWQDDRGMIQDPTCVSYEIPVSDALCDHFLNHWRTESAKFVDYCFTVQGPGRCNCVWAAVSVLKRFCEIHRVMLPGNVPAAQRLAGVTGPAQGELMRLIVSGRLLMG